MSENIKPHMCTCPSFQLCAVACVTLRFLPGGNMSDFSLSQALEEVMNLTGPVIGANEAPDLQYLPDVGDDGQADLENAFWGLDGDSNELQEPETVEGAPEKRRRLRKPLGYWEEKASQQKFLDGRRIQLSTLTHRARTEFRDCWVHAFIRSHGEELAGLRHRDKVRRVHTQYWSQLSAEARAGWFLHCVAPAEHAKPNLTGHDEGHAVPSVPEANQSAVVPFQGRTLPGEEKHPDDDLDSNAKERHMGYLLTWQGSWGYTDPEVRTLTSLSLKGAALVQAVKRSVFFRLLWDDFKAFAVHRARERGWPLYSGKCEVTLGAKDPHRNVVHFHLQVSDPNARKKLTDKAYWNFLGFQPHIQPTAGRGRYLFKATCNGHYYAQSPKIGSVFVFTNYPCFKECPVEQPYVFGLWKRYKMEDEIAQQEIVRARGRGTKGFLQEIDFNRRWRQAQMSKAERRFMEWSIPLKPSKAFKVVIDWMKLFGEEYGRATRFPFLVLNGNSRMGKTRYAAQLWGPEHTLVLSCQGVLQPNLKDFNRSIKCIVYDEANHAMVFANKQVFQAGLDEVMLGQSACNEQAYCCWLYAVPMVVSTNNWLLNAKEEEMDWLVKNSVVVDVTEPMWLADKLLPLTDASDA